MDNKQFYRGSIIAHSTNLRLMTKETAPAPSTERTDERQAQCH